MIDITPLRGVAAATGAALLLAAAAAVPAPASADSIAYVKDGDVWLSTGDGARQYRVTADGGYSSVSQADDGRMVALRGVRLRFLERDGRVISDIATPVSDPDSGKQFFGPYDPAISPDGQKVAYSYFWQYIGYDPACNPTNGCYVKKLYQGTGFTSPLRLTAWDEPGFRRQTGWIDPSWVGDEDRVMLHHPAEALNDDVVLSSPTGAGPNGDQSALVRWFSDPSATLSDGELSRDRTKVAYVGNLGEHLSIWRGLGGYPQTPVACYALRGAKGTFASPTWSHDGTRLAWAEDDGVHVIGLPDLRDGCGTPAESADRLLLPGAKSPDWGPADVPPARTLPVPGESGGSSGGGGGGSTPSMPNVPSTPTTPVPDTPTTPTTPTTPSRPVVPPARASVRVTTPRLRTALATGLPVTLTRAPAGAVRVVARLGRVTVATAVLRVPASGAVSGRARFTAAGRRLLARRASARLAITVAGVTRTVTLRR